MKKCKYQSDGYCIRPENDYCKANECKGCDHSETSIVTTAVTVTCETTVTQCDNCGEILTEPKTDC